jgi:hypothetical protein
MPLFPIGKSEIYRSLVSSTKKLRISTLEWILPKGSLFSLTFRNIFRFLEHDYHVDAISSIPVST